MKRGSLVGQSRQRKGRLIIVSQQQLSIHDYNWAVYQFGSFNPQVTANNYGFVSGQYQNVIRSVWSIPLSFTQNNYYFQQYYFAHYANVLHIQDSNILYITSSSWYGNYQTHNIQAIQSALSNQFGSSYCSGNQLGYVYSSRSQDQYGGIFRVVSVSWSGKINLSVFVNRYDVPSLFLLDQVNHNYGRQYMASNIFLDNYVYLVFQTIIKVVLCNGSPSSFYIHNVPAGDNIHSLFKYQTNWIIGFGTNYTANTPIVNLYQVINSAPILSFKKRYQLTNQGAYISASFWNPQGFLINPSSNTVVFNLYNFNSAPKVMNLGMYYLYVNTNLCIGPLPLNPPCPSGPSNTPLFGYVYKHYSSGSYSNATGQYVDRFTILQQGAPFYLYSSSNGQMQARVITPSPTQNLPQIMNPASLPSFVFY